MAPFAKLEQLPSRLLPVTAFLVSAAAQYARRPDLFRRPQFFAEDGVFYQHAHNGSVLATIFVQSNGYMQILPRLVAAAAQVVPLAWAPRLMLVAGVTVNALPAAFVVSRRMSVAIPAVSARLLLAALYIALPGANHAATILTYSQWHFSLLALMILIAEPPRSRTAHAVDAGVLLVSGLSGPYSLLLAPVAVIHWRLRPSVRSGLFAGLLVATGILQAITILTTGLAARSTTPRGASVFQFLRVVGGRVVYGATAGHYLQAAELPAWGNSIGSDRFIAIAGAAGLVFLALAFWRGTLELRVMLLYGAAIVGAVLITASAPPDGPPQWVVLGHQDALATYFIVPILCVYASAVWMLCQPGRAWRAAGAAVLGLALVFGIPRDWREDPLDDVNFPASVRAYDAAPAGATVVVPIAPAPWSIDLVKPPAATP